MIARAVERSISIYTSMAKHPVDAEARANLSRYLNLLFASGEADQNRLTVCGLAYLRSWDLKAVRNGQTAPVAAAQSISTAI
jgi:hypothetical protein